MAIYAKTARQMLVDLINEGNPDLPFPINEADYDFTVPEAITVTPEGHNTEIRLIAKPSSPYTGNVVLTYRRLNLSYLFRGTIPTVKKWVENTGSTTATTVRYTLHQLLPLYTKKYGINLETGQINDFSLREYHGNDPEQLFNISARGDSLIFVGATQARWVIGKRTLADLVQIDETEGRLYPDGNDFTEGATRKNYLTPLTYNIDFTMYHQENSDDWDRYGRDGSSYSFLYSYGLSRVNGGIRRDDRTQYRQNSLYREILDVKFRQALGFGVKQVPTLIASSDRHYDHVVTDGYYSSGIDVDNNQVSLGNIPISVISLPHSDYPEANSEFYNSAIVIDVPDDCPWGTGPIFLHYNK